MYAFVAGLLLIAAIAVAPGVGGFLHLNQPSTPVVTASPSAIPSSTPGPSTEAPSPSAKPEPSATPVVSDPDTATTLVRKYEDALVSGKWQVAFDLLMPTSATRDAGYATFKDERSAFFVSVGGRYTVGAPTKVTSFEGFPPLEGGADRGRAWLIEVDYPALAGNNAGFEQFIVMPDSTDTWRIWPVR